MKKMITFALAVLGLLCASQVKAQVNFGVKGGLNVTNMSFSESVFDASNQTGWFVGPTVKISLPLVGLGVDASALYDYRAADVTVENESQKVKQQQLAIPVNLRYGIGLGDVASVFAFAGPQWGINVGDSEFKWNDSSSYSLKKSNFSVNLGFGATLAKHLQVTANYNIACGKSADANWQKVSEKISKSDKSHNNSWQIALAYFF
ncbi:porin family protein [Segatella albensis]|jgi:opacity protein-like surface antigen|uniref:porin family protein n=1 Tax=Segatella albensis TaxID=77768 RepID=UPI000414984F|nr:porin family protein [Segatella albensis]